MTDTPATDLADFIQRLARTAQ